MNAGKGGDGKSTPAEGGAVRHRRKGKPQIAQAQPGFGDVLRDNPREVIVTVLGVVIAGGWGANLMSSGSVGTRLLGLVGIIAGLLLGVSYLLRYNPRYLRHPRWSSSRPRRTLRFVLAHGWVAFFAVYLAAGLSLVVTQR